MMFYLGISQRFNQLLCRLASSLHFHICGFKKNDFPSILAHGYALVLLVLPVPHI